jgi:hypothetical protein
MKYPEGTRSIAVRFGMKFVGNIDKRAKGI